MNNLTSQNQIHDVKIGSQRLDCVICNYRIDPKDESAFATFECNVRDFFGETFKVWQCPNCQTIHCLDVVDLDHYYANYPVALGSLTWLFRLIYGNLLSYLTKHGFSQNHSLLDYGCGVNGLFIQYLQQRGYANTYGYDPYGQKDGLGNSATLQKAPFDYILMQDVIEHVEDPRALLAQLDELLAPGGYILIGTPNAANIDLNRPDLCDNRNNMHIPYHLHIYTREVLESLGKNQGWEPVYFFDRAYDDTRWPILNARTRNFYSSLTDGSIDVCFQPIQFTSKVLTSPKFFFYSIFGYWLSLHQEMAVMFRKSI